MRLNIAVSTLLAATTTSLTFAGPPEIVTCPERIVGDKTDANSEGKCTETRVGKNGNNITHIAYCCPACCNSFCFELTGYPSTHHGIDHDGMGEWCVCNGNCTSNCNNIIDGRPVITNAEYVCVENVTEANKFYGYTSAPSDAPTILSTPTMTQSESVEPSSSPSNKPSTSPFASPSTSPTDSRTGEPSVTPSSSANEPSTNPSASSSTSPTDERSDEPSTAPSSGAATDTMFNVGNKIVLFSIGLIVAKMI